MANLVGKERKAGFGSPSFLRKVINCAENVCGMSQKGPYNG